MFFSLFASSASLLCLLRNLPSSFLFRWRWRRCARRFRWRFSAARGRYDCLVPALRTDSHQRLSHIGYAVEVKKKSEIASFRSFVSVLLSLSFVCLRSFYFSLSLSLSLSSIFSVLKQNVTMPLLLSDLFSSADPKKKSHTYSMPLLYTFMPAFGARIRSWSSTPSAEFRLEVRSDYFNSRRDEWEPLMEPIGFNIKFSSSPPPAHRYKEED